MNVEQQSVKEFHEAFDIAIASHPEVPDWATCRLRESLIEEEFKELKDAFMDQNIVLVADALADLLYVVYGTAVSCGLDMEPIFAEVHRSNMTKIGGHKREDGKWIKPATYSPANIDQMIDDQMVAAHIAAMDAI